MQMLSKTLEPISSNFNFATRRVNLRDFEENDITSYLHMVSGLFTRETSFVGEIYSILKKK